MELTADRCPELWLLGKTGAGKTALARFVTLSAPAETSPTRAPARHSAPGAAPDYVLVDIPGLGGAGPDAPLPQAMDALVIVHRLDDMVTAPLLDSLRAVVARKPDTPALLVLTGADLAGSDAARAEAFLSAQITGALGRALPVLSVQLLPGGPREPLLSALSTLAADVSRARAALRLRQEERRAFEHLRPMVLRHATAAGLSDAAPLIGAVTVPAVQARMLSALAKSHGLTWTPRRAGLFAGALGAGALANFGAAYALRQGAKLVPVVGPVVGGAAAMSLGFAATFALGRAAAAWLFHEARGEAAAPDTLRAIYAESYRDRVDGG